MKNLITVALVCLSIAGTAQSKEEVIRKEYSFEKKSEANVFRLANINGYIKVEIHNSDTYVLEARKRISAKTNERLALGIKEIGLGLKDKYDTLVVYMSSPCHIFNQHKEGRGNRYGYSYNDCESKYDFKIDMTLKVPANANLVLSTVNNGDIEVRGVSGNLRVNNVNGAILLDDVSGMVVAHTINGDVDVNYSKNPSADSRYYTLNGDINANFRSGLAAKIAFKSFNGDMFTNLPSLATIPGEIKQEKVDNGKGIKFKIEDRTLVQTRNGKVLLDFETFNGDAIIKEK